MVLRFNPRKVIWNYSRERDGFRGLIKGTKLWLSTTKRPPVNYMWVGKIEEAYVCYINIPGLPLSSKDLLYSNSPVNSAIIYTRS